MGGGVSNLCFGGEAGDRRRGEGRRAAACAEPQGEMGLSRQRREGKAAAYIRPTATSSTLSLSAKSVKPSQRLFTDSRALRPVSRRVSSASSRRGIVGGWRGLLRRSGESWMGVWRAWTGVFMRAGGAVGIGCCSLELRPVGESVMGNAKLVSEARGWSSPALFCFGCGLVLARRRLISTVLCVL